MKKTTVSLLCLILSVNFLLTPPSSTGDGDTRGSTQWIKEVVDEGEGVARWYAGFDLDVNDHPHIAYSHAGVWYVTWNGFQWKKELVDEKCDFRGRGELVVDSSGVPHIFYHDKNPRLRHAYRGEDGWHVEIIEDEVFWDVNAVAGPDGRLYVAYRDPQKQAKLAEWRGGSWSFEVINSSSTGYPAVTLDAAGNPVVAYVHNRVLMVARREGSNWVYSTVENSVSAGQVSMVTDSSGVIHLTYMNDYGIYYAKSTDGTNWAVEEVAGPGSGEHPSIDVDSTGIPHVAYRDYNQHMLVYAKREGGSWSVEELGSGTKEDIEVKVASDDTPRICFFHGDSAYLASWGGSQWSIERVPTGRGVKGWGVRMLLDGDGRPHLLYREIAENYTAIKYARKDTEGWVQDVVAYRDPSDLSFALDSTGLPAVAYTYYNSSLGSPVLAYVKWTGSTWVESRVLDSYTIFTLVMDLSDRPHLICVKSGEGLVDMHWTGTAWESDVIDITVTSTYVDDITADTDSEGRLHVAYNTDGHLKYAHWTGSRWDTQWVDMSEDVGESCSLTVDSTGYPHIAYYDEENETLRYAHWSGDGWEIEVVDSGLGSVYGYPRFNIDVDPGDHPHISYFEYSQKRLKYAWWDGAIWHVEVVDSYRWAGYSSSLALDEDGTVHIAYYNGYSLLYAFEATPPGPPRNLEATAEGDHILLTWEPPVYNGGYNVTSYIIYRGTDPSTLSPIDMVNTTSYRDEGVEKGVKYYYMVTAVNPVGVGEGSNLVNVTLVTTPSSPRGLKAEAGVGVVNLTWSPPEDTGGLPLLNYTIYRGTSPHDLQVLSTLPGNVTFFSDREVEGGHTYYYAVSAVNSRGEGNRSEVVNATPTSPAPQPGVDSDSDGLPDAWEMEHFGTLNYTAEDDPDGDGYTNMQEYSAGTDPEDASEHPGKESGGETGGGGGEEKKGLWERWGVALLILILLVGILLGVAVARMGRRGEVEE